MRFGSIIDLRSARRMSRIGLPKRRDRPTGNRAERGEPDWPPFRRLHQARQAGHQWQMALDEVVVPINGVKFRLCRAVDAGGTVLDILGQKQRKAKAASRFLKRLIDRFGAPRVVITGKLRSYIRPIRSFVANSGPRAHKGFNNRIERSHQLVRRRENSWGSSDLPNRPRDFWPHMTRSTGSSVPAAIVFPPRPIRCLRPLEPLRTRDDRLTGADQAAFEPSEYPESEWWRRGLSSVCPLHQIQRTRNCE